MNHLFVKSAILLVGLSLASVAGDGQDKPATPAQQFEAPLKEHEAVPDDLAKATSDKEDRKGRREGRSVQGFEPKVLGYLTWDRNANAFTRFDVIAVGDACVTPHGDHHFNYRPGRYPVGISMELVSGKTAAERVPPRASVVYDTPNSEYFATGK